MPERKYLYLLLAVLSVPVLWGLDGSYTYGLGVFYGSGVAPRSTLGAAVSLIALLLLSPIIVFARNAYRKAKGRAADFRYLRSILTVLLGVVLGFTLVMPGMSLWRQHSEDEQLKALYTSLRAATTQAQIGDALKERQVVSVFEVNPSHRLRDKRYVEQNHLTLTPDVSFIRLSYPSGNAFSPRATHIFVSVDKRSERILAMCFARDDILTCD